MTSDMQHRNRSVRPELTDELLSAYIDGDLSAQERERVEAVLARSTVDRENMELLQQTVTLLRQLPRAPLPRAFVLSEAQVGIRRTERRTWNIFAFLRTATVATAMLFSVLWGGDYFLRQTTPGVAPAGAPDLVAMQPSQTSAQSATPATDADTPAPATPGSEAETPPTTAPFTAQSAPADPATKQAAPPDTGRMLAVPAPEVGGGEGRGGGGGAGGPGGMGGDAGPLPGGETGPFGDPMPSIVPLPEDTPEPSLSMNATGESAADEPTPTPSPTEPPQVALMPDTAGGAGEETTPSFLPETDADAVSELRQWRDRWALPLRVAEMALGVLFIGLLAATVVTGRRR